jgi:ATP-dependent RNA helicase DeaD
MERIKFQELPLSEEIQRAIVDLGYEEASPIQTAAIPVLLEGRDRNWQDCRFRHPYY